MSVSARQSWGRPVHTGHDKNAPPLSADERSTSLQVLENQLNGAMTCPAGRNQVHIRSKITGVGQTTQPRIMLQCHLRKDAGESPDLYYEEIKSLCCSDHKQCSAWQQAEARFMDL